MTTLQEAQERHGKPFRSHTRHARVSQPSPLLEALQRTERYTEEIRLLSGREAVNCRCDACGREL